MRKVLSIVILGTVVLGGVVVGMRTAQPVHAMTWGQLKCQYNPDCVARQKKAASEDNKNAG